VSDYGSYPALEDTCSKHSSSSSANVSISNVKSQMALGVCAGL